MKLNVNDGEVDTCGKPSFPGFFYVKVAVVVYRGLDEYF